MSGLGELEEKNLCRVGGAAWMISAILAVLILPLGYLSSTSQADLSGLASIARGLTELQQQSPYFASVWIGLAAFEFVSVAGFLALYFVLRRTSNALAALVLVMWIVGVAIDVAGDISPRLSIIGLSDSYVSAGTEAQKAAYVASAQLAITSSSIAAFATGVPFGLAFVLVGYLMLKNDLFNRTTAYSGIAGGIPTLAIIPLWGHATAILAVAAASAIPILFWVFLTGYKLYRLR